MMNYFSHNPLDRRFELRTDAGQQQRLWRHPHAQVLLFQKDKSLFRQGADALQVVALPQNEATALAPEAAVQVFLGLEGEVPYFALCFDGPAAMLAAYQKEPYLFCDLREVAPQLPQEQSAILAHARAMVHWNLHHRHCAYCGSPTTSMEAGHMRQCTNEACGRHHFPRTDTAVIMLVAEGDACLLGRQASWPKGRYATLAGFLEPGETLEQAVAREVMEETGAALSHISYHSSQPWPFPASLMVGFMATAQSRDLKVNHAELEDARWFTREQIAEGLQRGDFLLPPALSISHRLIRDWYDTAPGYDLASVLR